MKIINYIVSNIDLTLVFSAIAAIGAIYPYYYNQYYFIKLKKVIYQDYIFKIESEFNDLKKVINDQLNNMGNNQLDDYNTRYEENLNIFLDKYNFFMQKIISIKGEFDIFKKSFSFYDKSHRLIVFTDETIKKIYVVSQLTDKYRKRLIDYNIDAENFYIINNRIEELQIDMWEKIFDNWESKADKFTKFKCINLYDEIDYKLAIELAKIDKFLDEYV